MTSEQATKKAFNRAGLGIQYRLLVVAYVAAVVLLSYRENLTLAAKAVGMLIGSATLFLVFAKGKRIVVPTTYRIWGSWFLLVLVSCVFAEDMVVALNRALTVAQVAIVGFLVTNFIIWNRSTRFYTMALVGAALASAVMVLNNPGTFASIDGRVHGTLGNANTFGVMLSVSLTLSLVAALSSRNLIIKVVFFLTGSVIFNMLLQTGSRKAMLAGVLLGGGLISVAYLYKSGAATFRSLIMALITIAILIPIGFTLLVNSEFWYRTERAIAAFDGDMSDADSSLTGRLWLAKRAVSIAIANPLIGIGLDTFRMKSGSGIGVAIGTYSHSNYLEILVSTGIFGFVLYFSIYWLWFKRLYLRRRYLRSPVHFGRYTSVTVVVIMVAVMDISMVSYYDKVMWLVLPWVVAELHLFEMEEKRHLLNQKNKVAEENIDDHSEKLQVAVTHECRDSRQFGQNA